MNDVKIGNREFKLLKIDALAQFHIVRRIGPILGELMPAMTKIAAQKKNIDSMTEEQKLEQLAQFGAPIMTGLSKLNDVDADYVLFGLLRAVEMKQENGNWMRLVQGNPPILMAQDLDFATMLQLAGRAFGYNLSGFFSALPRQ